MGGGDAMQFSGEVEAALAEVLASDDPLDSPHFNAIEYVNKLFPTEQSLQNIDTAVARLKIKVRCVQSPHLLTSSPLLLKAPPIFRRRVDHEIRDAIHTQTATGIEGALSLSQCLVRAPVNCAYTVHA